jgi:hypothetical protein
MPVVEIAHGRHQPDALAARPERPDASAQVGNGFDDAHDRPPAQPEIYPDPGLLRR